MVGSGRLLGRMIVALAALGLAAGAAAQAPVQAQVPEAGAMPDAAAMARQMGRGWNLGNNLEAMAPQQAPRPLAKSQEAAWNNPKVDLGLFAKVKAAGFSTLRLPVAWNQYADAQGVIAPFWLDRVAQVVDAARKAGLVVLLNAHWDGGWAVPSYAARDAVLARQAMLWRQIAARFADYDGGLLLAGSNEVHIEGQYGPPTPENCAVQRDLNRVFVETLRASGGRNLQRVLVVQSYNTNIDAALGCNLELPKDSAVGRLMMEVHFYDPYNFTLNEKSTVWQWGDGATDKTATDTWGGPAHVDAQFARMQAAFVNKGVPVVLGEYGAIRRDEHAGALAYRDAWVGHVTASALRHGLIPVYWDEGLVGNHGMGLFDRATGALVAKSTLAAIMGH